MHDALLQHRLGFGWLIALLAMAGLAETSAQPATQPATTRPAMTQPVGAGVFERFGVTLDREAGHLDVQATVVLREGWLEALVCLPQTKEHESILRVQAPASLLHMALLQLGAEAGHPLKVSPDGQGGHTVTPPQGTPVSISILLRPEAEGGIPIPANQWVENQQTGKLLSDPIWVFAGSKQLNGPEGSIYLADLEGVVVTIVNFGLELLARPTTTSDRDADHGQAWHARTEAIPPVGTPVILRLQPHRPAPESP